MNLSEFLMDIWQILKNNFFLVIFPYLILIILVIITAIIKGKEKKDS